LEQVAADGKKRKMNLYNLDMIISVGCRVKFNKSNPISPMSHTALKRLFGLRICNKLERKANLGIKQKPLNEWLL
jgi:hypothetical protein